MTERFDPNDQAYAPADSLHGLLQRGRGAGALRVLDEPGATGAVRDVLRQDWRWDAVDDRHLYLARLVHDLRLPLDPLLGLLAGDEDECERATRVLELLAVAGSADARTALRAYVRDGEHWVDVLESVADAWPVEWWDDLAYVARTRLADEQLLPGGSRPWARWGMEVPAASPRRPGRAHTAEVGPDGRRLLSVLADAGSADGAKAQALYALAGRPPEPGLLALVPGLGTADGERPLPWLGRAVERLGALAVPEARAWAADEREWLSWTGVRVLAEHGEDRDLPTLIGELASHEKARQWCGPGLLASGLARFGPAASEAAPVLHRLWLRTPHSYERPALLKALAAIAPAGLGLAYTESLWDCEAEARLLGVASAPDLPHVHRRLAELRADPMEEREVRAAAGARIAAGRR
ncbi:hypothetical protein [Streptomyces albireticuli]|uniref:hypothetical protein n=1 Tax=Streptomyces albireticuli TaxID=1940 RepID=UPI001331A1A7|nr:hypothetical protein [Streptomyces albireticuli]